MMDYINAGFEIGGSLALWLNVYAIHKAKGYAGIHLAQTGFVMLWCLWALIFYAHLNQWASFVAGINVALAYATWTFLAFYYGKIEIPKND